MDVMLPCGWFVSQKKEPGAARYNVVGLLNCSGKAGCFDGLRSILSGRALQLP